VYEFLLRYVVSSDTDAKVAKRHIDQNFVVHLLDLFDSGGWQGEQSGRRRRVGLVLGGWSLVHLLDCWTCLTQIGGMW
jgi:hypothetical protein